MRLHRAAWIGLSFLLLACTAVPPLNPAPDPGTPTGDEQALPTLPVSASPQGDIADLTAAGVAVIGDEAHTADADGHLLLTRIQAERLLADLDGGVHGAQLDAMLPATDGMVPVSYLVAGWITSAGTPAAGTAGRWMEMPDTEIDWSRAPEVRFPLAVVALFAADMARLADENLPHETNLGDTHGIRPLAATGRFHNAGVVVDAPVAADGEGPCSTVTNFLARAIDGLFSALRLKVPASGGGFFQDVARVLASVWNTAVGYAERVVQGLAAAITAPVFEAIRLAVGVLGVATVLVSYLNDQTMSITLVPQATQSDSYRFAIGSEPDIRGEFVARPRSLTGSWPPFVVDCAKTAGAKLPELIAPGAEANWTVRNFAIPVIFPAASELRGRVRQDLTARLSFITGRESEETAQGDVWWDAADATVAVPRREVNDFFQLARDQLEGAMRAVASEIPEPNVRAIAEAKLKEIVDPVVDQLEGELSQRLPTIFTLTGTSGALLVQYHRPPEETPAPTPPSTPDPKREFCTRYRALLTWWWGGSLDELGRQEWASEVVRRFTEMRPFASSSVSTAVEIHIGLYDVVATRSGPELAVEAAPWAAQMPDAVATLDSYCAIQPGEFPGR